MHLMALSYEYDIKLFKINDLFIEAKDGSLMFQIKKESEEINWKLVSEIKNYTFYYKILLKLFIRIIHLYFYIFPFKKSYKIGSSNNFPKFIIGKNLSENFSIDKLIKESSINNIVVAGWALRDWNLFEKHKKLISKNIIKGFGSLTNKKLFFEGNYILVHIRRSDFLKVKDFDALNFSDETWAKSIIMLSNKLEINNIVMFSDSSINNLLIADLRRSGINVFLPENLDNNRTFLQLFINYISNAHSIICNSSTLVLSISILFHEYIYLPSEDSYQNICLKNAHNSYPTFLNWN
tara:strand:+ start:14452 stop:15333 length:882 start_codon:yes stop_codon:yes gene_type:complete